jgi:hypothetical protein
MLQSIRRFNLFVLFVIWSAPPLRAEAEQITPQVRSGYSQPAKPVVAPKPSAREYYLGVFTDPVPEVLAIQKAELLVDHQGVLVKYVLPNSPAEKAGLKPNDILTVYGDQKLSSPQQLKRLVVGYTLVKPVTVQVVRGETSRTVDVHLAERVVNWTHGSAGLQKISGPGVIRLKNRGGVPIFVAQDGMTLSGSEIRWEIRTIEIPIAPQKPEAVEVQNQAILISSINGLNFQLEITHFDKNGRSSATQLEGTTDEITLQIGSGEKNLSDDVKTSLDWAKSQVRQQRTIQLRLQPRLEGTRRGVRILMSRPEGEQTIRCLQCDHYFEENQPMDAAVFLSAEPLLSELSRLHPVIREKVESTLLNTRLPIVSFNVERSQ